MVPTNAFFFISEIILAIKLTLISSISNSKLPLSTVGVNMTCQIEYNSYKTAIFKLWFQFDDNISRKMSHWDFGLEKCEPNMQNQFCKTWEKESTNVDTCKMVTNSSQVFCSKQINLYAEVRSTKPYHYRFFASHISKDIVSKEIGKIRYLKCGCKHFDFEQTLKIVFPYLGKADIEIGPFYDIPKLKDTKLNIVPNNHLSIKKYNDERFEISGLNICPTYSINVKLRTWPTCTNWKIKSTLLQVPLDGLTVNDISCKFNQTHVTLNRSVDSDSQFYYNFSFVNKIFTRNVTKKVILPGEWVKTKPQNNITIFVRLCAHGCKTCGTEMPFICYSEITTVSSKEEISKIVSPYLWFLFGIIFVFIFAALMWAKYAGKARICNKKEVMNAFYFPKEKLINEKEHKPLTSTEEGCDVGISHNHNKDGIVLVKTDNEK